MNENMKDFTIKFVLGLVLTIIILMLWHLPALFAVYFMAGWTTPDIFRLIIKKVKK